MKDFPTNPVRQRGHERGNQHATAYTQTLAARLRTDKQGDNFAILNTGFTPGQNKPSTRGGHLKVRETAKIERTVSEG